MFVLSPPSHGGDVVSASKQFGIELKQWIDLSTGMNPLAYPHGAVAQHAFQKLPYQSLAFEQSVRDYYGDHAFLAGNGSQQFITWLPKLLVNFPVLLPEFGYQEHARFWALNENIVSVYPSLSQPQAISCIEEKLEQKQAFHLVIINPNNPTGLLFSPQQLRLWAKQMQPGAKMIVDEAFVDSMEPNCSLLNESLPDNVVVLRSFGKFYGLAGVRLGFAFAQRDLIEQLDPYFGVWNVNGPAQTLAIKALRDRQWQNQNRENIECNAGVTIALFSPLFESVQVISEVHLPLFSSYVMSSQSADRLYQHFARAGILLRMIPLSTQKSLIRIGRISSIQTQSAERVRGAVECFLKAKH